MLLQLLLLPRLGKHGEGMVVEICIDTPPLLLVENPNRSAWRTVKVILVHSHGPGQTLIGTDHRDSIRSKHVISYGAVRWLCTSELAHNDLILVLCGCCRHT